MTHKPYLPCLNASIDFPPFHNTLASQRRHICVHALARPYPNKNNVRWSVTDSYASCSSPLFLSTLRSLPLSVTLINTRCGSLEYIFGLINSWCSASQLLIALTQAATNW
ncbi:unnamed protein product [Hymenolepis diminuta]|uniref:Uncharacterized protein n=1 Tax=Hymenolepis diminuta TaxID=6216 RepID=A0A564Z6K6_HYMDI|nr:unnamed protein product [Hymenolepis diminuta]